MTTKTRLVPWDTAKALDTPELQAIYLSQALEEGDPTEVLQAIGVVARARGMTAVAKETGLGRESLYKSLGENGNPAFVSVLKVIQSLGMKVSVKPI